ncbi:MAG: hypothetical protein M1834_007382 [Cirrosporium novae-zelandiae]|nr:MAG: hypothetical protein M1834_007382 [Cirrosporium novae-zelandiae]
MSSRCSCQHGNRAIQNQNEDTVEPFQITSKPNLLLILDLGEGTQDAEDIKRQNPQFLVSTAILEKHSGYFRALFSLDGFREGTEISRALAQIEKEYGNVENAPREKLPRVTVKRPYDVPVAGATESMKSLLRILQGDILADWSPSTRGMAIICVLADAFDCLMQLQAFSKARVLKYRSRHPKSEATLRQEILIAMLTKNPKEFERSFGGNFNVATHQLVIRGSQNWESSDKEQSDVNKEAPRWWHLPNGLEEELASRRIYLLETIKIIQTYCLAKYSAKERQCRLGYEDSPQCDSFQLGEMVRFFNRIGTIDLTQTTDPIMNYTGDVSKLLRSFSSCPSYQICSHHSHCGLRTMLIPMLDRLQTLVNSGFSCGICLSCWQHRPDDISWDKPASNNSLDRREGHAHAEFKSFFTDSKRKYILGATSSERNGPDRLDGPPIKTKGSV